ncbi:hypothetical protein SAMN03080598_03681 [Algoriphagus boritolerans DSM 17298 = JCM 18970]|uniref:Uncharacterized protein n=1 Tax=Algoriphagus boritolerans DSM 17298 = JCM 18970 TaxID=1120964 RepID=A0A1H5ZS12_9BACT|nr:hypothetical protein SAMN03080598_03681 [Algoriphagus boritolerans DSM 17298 = JCM 18970]
MASTLLSLTPKSTYHFPFTTYQPERASTPLNLTLCLLRLKIDHSNWLRLRSAGHFANFLLQLLTGLHLRNPLFHYPLQYVQGQGSPTQHHIMKGFQIEFFSQLRFSKFA